jgi:hypothetical protein
VSDDRPPKKPLPTGLLVSLAILAAVFFFILSVCGRG